MRLILSVILVLHQGLEPDLPSFLQDFGSPLYISVLIIFFIIVFENNLEHVVEQMVFSAGFRDM